MAISFSRAISNQAGSLRTVYVRHNNELCGGEYLYSFEKGSWKFSEGLVERYRRGDMEWARLSAAKETVLFAARMLRHGME